MKNFNSMADDYNTSQSNLVAGAANAAGEQVATAQASGNQHQQHQLSREAPNRSSSSRQQLLVDEMSQDLTYLSREAPLDGGESTFGAANSYSQLAGAGREDSVLHMGSELPDQQQQQQQADGNNFSQNNNLRSSMSSQRQLTASPTQLSYSYNESTLDQLSPDNVDLIQKPLQQAGQSSIKPATVDDATDSSLPLKPFLVSFMVDARGGAMRGCRHSGVRVIIPPNSAQMPMRITCRYLRRERLVHPPPLMEGEACASKIMEVGPAGAKFLGPVLIEVPHFASLRGKEREIIILRSDSGEVWREHLVEADERLVEQIIRSARSTANTDNDNGAFSDQENQQTGAGGGSGGESGEKRRLTRIVTNEFPQYFAIISRIRQEVHAVGPEGTTINSQVVPKVQAIFTEGALTKRIKIGLQGNKKQQDNQQQLTARADSPAAAAGEQDSAGEHLADSLLLDEHGQVRAASPQSNRGSATQTPRPGSSATQHKRPRSRFLACFGAGHGSVDLLNGATTDDSSAGGDSPRQPCNEALVKQRHILGDVSDSEAELSSSQLSGELGDANRKSAASTRVKRHVQRVELVPDDYYIEREQPLILNEEPKTYGKRLKSSSAQTDSKLNVNGYLSTSTKKSAGKKRRGLLPGKRKNKTQLNILCDDQFTAHRPKSATGEQVVADSSLDTIDQQQQQNDQDEISLIRDVFTSDDHKWRTCTIQTDSDSVTVNYVMAASAPGEITGSAPNSAQDDGYASGSGDLNRQSSFGKGLFGFGSSTPSDKQAADEAKRIRKQRAKKAAKKEKAAKEKSGKKVSAPEVESVTAEPLVSDIKTTTTTTRVDSPELPSTAEVTVEKQQVVVAAVGQQTDDEQQQVADLSLTGDSSIGPRSVSPTSNKELKLKLKLEKRDKEKREKEEKRLLKEQEEAAEKLKKKQEKEAKEAEKLAKEAEKLAKKAEKQAQKAAKKSPTSSKPSTPLPPSESSAIAAPTGGKTSSVKFASQLIESDSDSAKDAALKSISQEDGHDMVRVSISEKLAEQGPVSLELQQQQQPVVSPLEITDRTISFSTDSEEVSKSLIADPSESAALKQQQPPSEPASASEHLKPILKQQSTVSTTSGGTDEVSAELLIDEKRDLASVASKLVSEATEKAVREADRLSREPLKDSQVESTVGDGAAAADQSSSSATLSKKELDKLEKERLKKEAKAKLDEEKRLAKEAKQLAKEAELVKKAEEAEAKKAAKAAKAELERQAKEAKVELERQAKEAKAEQERLAKEAKLKLKLELKEKSKSKSKDKSKKDKKDKTAAVESSSEAAPSAPPVEQVVESTSSSSDESTKSTSEALPAQQLLSETSVSTKIDEAVEKVEKLSPTIEPESVATAAADSSKSAEAPVVKDATDASVESGGKKKAVKEKKVKEPKVKVQKEKSKKKAAALPVPAVSTTTDQPEVSETTEPTTTATASKSSFFSRLFSRRSKSPKKSTASEKSKLDADGKSGEEQVAAAKQQLGVDADGKPIILSEMYPSDPYDAESEMILEVNVPKNLICKQQSQHHVTKRQLNDDEAPVSSENFAAAKTAAAAAISELSQASDGPTSPTLGATTIDESLVTTDDHGLLPATDRWSSSAAKVQVAEQPADDQATLVNVSQTVASDLDELDDDATENVVSQTIELVQSSVETPSESVAVKVKRSVDEAPVVEISGEPQVVASSASESLDQKLITAEPPQLEALAGTAAASEVVVDDKSGKSTKLKVKKSKAELKEEKDRKELEAKLEKEAKKRAEEEEKLAKKLVKEEKQRLKVEKKQAEIEAKRLAKEAKAKAKLDAQEAKRLAKLAGKQLKKDKKLTSGETSGATAAAAATSEQVATSGETSAAKLTTSGLEGTAPQAEVSGKVDAGEAEAVAAEVEREMRELSSMTPVNTETEVQRIVEEVVGEDGVVTRTTKTVETKYVTLRSEELHLGEVRKMPLEEYERLVASGELPASTSIVEPQAAEFSASIMQPTSSKKLVNIVVGPYEHEELDAIRATPSYFAADQRPVELEGVECGSPKKELKKRIKLNQRLIKRAKKLAKSEAKKAKRDARLATNEIATCDEAAKQARNELKRAVKQAKKAAKLAAKQHRKMDKVDKKLAKRQSKIDKRQRKLDKLAAKVAAKEAKKRAKREAKEAKAAAKLSKQSSLGSASRKSIKLEDIGQPVLHSSSRLSLNRENSPPAGGDQQVAGSSSGGSNITTRMVSVSNSVINRRESPTSDDIQVEMSLEQEAPLQQQQQPQEQLLHTITTETVVEHPDGQVSRQVSERRLTGKEAAEAAERMNAVSAESEDEEIDVVNDLPVIPAAISKREAANEPSS